MIKRKATICDLLVKFNSKNTKVCASTEKKGKVNPCKWEVTKQCSASEFHPNDNKKYQNLKY